MHSLYASKYNTSLNPTVIKPNKYQGVKVSSSKNNLNLYPLIMSLDNLIASFAFISGFSAKIYGTKKYE